MTELRVFGRSGSVGTALEFEASASEGMDAVIVLEIGAAVAVARSQGLGGLALLLIVERSCLEGIADVVISAASQRTVARKRGIEGEADGEKGLGCGSWMVGGRKVGLHRDAAMAGGRRHRLV